jgi:hypothetical protein
MADTQVKLPEGYEDAKPVNEDNSQQQVSLPPGYEDAKPAEQSAGTTDQGNTPEKQPSTFDKATSVTKKGWEKANTPTYTPSEQEQNAYMRAKNYSTSAPTKEESDSPIWTGIKKGAAGAYADTTDTLRSFTSPVGMATLASGSAGELPGAVGKAAGALGKIAGLGFGAQGAKEAYEGGKDIAQHGVTPENVRQTTGGAGQALLGATAGGEMLGKGAKLIHDLPEVDAKIKAGVQKFKDTASGARAKGLVGNEYMPPAKGAVPPAKAGALPRIEYATPTPNGAEPNLVGPEHAEGTMPAHEAPVTPKGAMGRIEYAEPTPSAATKEPGLVGNEHTEAQAPAGEAQPRNPVQGVEYGEHQPAATTPDKEITPEMVKSTPGTSMSPEGKALVEKLIGKQEAEPAAKEPDMAISDEITKRREAKQAEQQTARDKEIAEEGGYTEPGKTNPKPTGTGEVNKPTHSDEAHMTQAREELGEAAPTSAVLARAKELQDEAGKAHEARTAPKEEVDNGLSSSEAQRAEHDASGGSTFTPEGENLKGAKKFSVGSYPERTQTLPNLSDADLRRFKAENLDLLKQPDHAVGSWKDNHGNHVLDVVKLYDDRDAAIAAGKAANQQGIYGLENGEYIDTGGTGKGTVDEAKAQAEAEAPKTNEGATDKTNAASESKAAPEDVTAVNNIVKDLGEQDIIKAGRKYDVDHEDYDFKKRDENRHRVERDQYAKDLTETIPDEMKQRLIKAADAFDDSSDQTFTDAERSNDSRAQRAKAIWDMAHTEWKPVSGGSQAAEGVGTEENPIVKRAKDFSDTGNYEVKVGDKRTLISRDPESGYWYHEGPGHFSERVAGFSKGDAVEAAVRKIDKYPAPPDTEANMHEVKLSSKDKDVASWLQGGLDAWSDDNAFLEDVGHEPMKSDDIMQIKNGKLTLTKDPAVVADALERLEAQAQDMELPKDDPDYKSSKDFARQADRLAGKIRQAAGIPEDMAHSLVEDFLKKQGGSPEEQMKAKGPAPEASTATARMSDEELLKHGFTKEDIEAGKHLPEAGGGGKGKSAAAEKGIPEAFAKHMTPEEIASVTKTDRGTQSFLESMAKLPSVQEYTDIALAGEGARKWYQRSSSAFDAVKEEAPKYFDQPGDKDKFIGLLASSSPRQSVAMNMRETLGAWKAYVDAGRPEGEALKTLLRNQFTLPNTKIPNAMKALAGEKMWPDLSKNTAFKAPSFERNLRGWLDYSTNDGWMALFGGVDPAAISKASSYHPLSVATRAAAKELGWETAEAQAAIWSFTQALTERGEELPEEIRRQSEDFADILAHDPQTRQLVSDLGVNLDQLDTRLKAIGEKPEVTGRTTGTTSRSIGKLKGRIEEARGKGAIPPSKSAQGEMTFREPHPVRNKSRIELPEETADEDTSFEPEKLDKEESEAIPLNKLYDRSAVLIAPDGKLMSIPEYDPRSESPQHPELLRKSGYKGDMTKFLKEGGVRAYTTGPEEAGVEIQNDSPETIQRALRVVDGLDREKTRFEIADPKTFRTTFSASGTYSQIKAALDKRK